VKLLLFDLDGTILHATHSPGRVPFDLAMHDVFGVEVALHRMRPDGKTDPLIVAELLALAGASVTVDAAALQRFHQRLGVRLAAAIAVGATKVDAVPGVRRLLDLVAHDDRFALAVLTGNLEAAAELKLRAAGLDAFFPVGAFGSDHAERGALPEIARARHHLRSGAEVSIADCVIVGDTPLDHAAAACNGMDCILVASGRVPLADLLALRPAAAFGDWSDAEAIHGALTRL
jgi:phosphoglycolate phosphatase-like HAD superfamily hydrolase